VVEIIIRKNKKPSCAVPANILLLNDWIQVLLFANRVKCELSTKHCVAKKQKLKRAEFCCKIYRVTGVALPI
jgi:hypothetical protein